MAKKQVEGETSKPAAKAKTTKPAGKAKPKAKKEQGGANTTPLTGRLTPIEARLIGDQLRGMAYLAKKLALALREKNLPSEFNPADLEAVSKALYEMALANRRYGDDGSNGG